MCPTAAPDVNNMADTVKCVTACRFRLTLPPMVLSSNEGLTERVGSYVVNRCRLRPIPSQSWPPCAHQGLPCTSQARDVGIPRDAGFDFGDSLGGQFAWSRRDAHDPRTLTSAINL